MADKVTVLSAGAGGCTMAFHLSQVGYKVLLYQDENHTKSIKALIKTKKIISHPEYEGYKSPLHGAVNLDVVTTSIKEAINFSKIIILMVPAFGQLGIFRDALPYLTKDHIFISMPGNNAIFDYVEELRRKGTKVTNPIAFIKGVPIPCVFAECSIIPYACRKLQENEIFVGAIKEFIYTGCFPNSRTDATLQRLNPVFQRLDIRLEKKDLLEVIFYNSNLILHPVVTVYNAGHIKHLNKGFRFYEHGVSPLVVKIFDEVDNEMKKIAESYGFTLEPFSSYYKRYYGEKSNRSMFNFLQDASFLHFVKAPSDLNGRFISEDMEYVLIPIIQFLARKRGLATPICDAIISSLSCMAGRKLHPLRQISEEVWNDITKQK